LRIGVNLLGQIGDKWGRHILGKDEQWEIDREYDRYETNHLWQQDKETNLERGVKDLGYEKLINDDISSLAEFVEPIGTLIPLGKAGQVAQKAGKFGVKKASVPLQISQSAKDFLSGYLGPNMGKMAERTIDFGGGGIELMAGAVKDLAVIPEDVLTALAEPSGRQRFLQRLAKSDTKLMNNPSLKKKLAQAHEYAGSWVGDKLFGAVVNSASITAIEGSLQGLAGANAEAIGERVGPSMALGTAMTALSRRGAGDDLSTGREVNGEYVPSSRTEAQITSFVEHLGDKIQKEEFVKLPKYAQAIVSILDANGMSQGIRTRFVDERAYDDLMTEAVLRGEMKVSDYMTSEGVGGMIDPKERARATKIIKSIGPSAFYNARTNSVFVRENTATGKPLQDLQETLIKELTRPIIKNLVANDHFMAEKILKPYLKSKFLGEKGTDYSLGDRTVTLDKDVDQFVSDYNKSGRGDLTDAGDIAAEMASEQFSMLLSKDPGQLDYLGGPGSVFFNSMATSVLDMLEIDHLPTAGSKLNNPVSETLKQSPHIQNLLKNQVKLARKSSDYLLELADMPAEITPTRKGQTTAQAYQDFYAHTGQDSSAIPLADTLKFIDATKRQVIKSIAERDKDNPRYAGYSLRDKTAAMDKASVVPAGPMLSPEMKQSLVDELGEGNVVLQQVDLLEQMIAQSNWTSFSHLKEKMTWEKTGSLKKGINTYKSLKGHEHYKNKHNKADDIVGVPHAMFFNKKLDLLAQIWTKKNQDANTDAIIAYNMRKGLGHITSKADFKKKVDDLRQRIMVQKGDESLSFKDQYKVGDEWIIAALLPGQRTDADGSSLWKNPEVKKMMDEVNLKPAFRSVRFDRLQNKLVNLGGEAPPVYYPNARDVN
jgi:hypothetical protein